jgi:hypothetical protein
VRGRDGLEDGGLGLLGPAVGKWRGIEGGRHGGGKVSVARGTVASNAGAAARLGVVVAAACTHRQKCAKNSDAGQPASGRPPDPRAVLMPAGAVGIASRMPRGRPLKRSEETSMQCTGSSSVEVEHGFILRRRRGS